MKKDNNDFSFKSKQIKYRQGINDDTKTIISLIVILLIVGLIIALISLFNGKYVNKTKEETTTTTKVSFDPSLTTIDSMFNIGKDKYYVLVYDYNKEADAVLYSGYSYAYTKSTPLYFVDLSNAMNKKYVDKKATTKENPGSAKDVVISKPVLYVFSKGKITSTITDKNKILEKLN